MISELGSKIPYSCARIPCSYEIIPCFAPEKVSFQFFSLRPLLSNFALLPFKAGCKTRKFTAD